MPRQYTPRIPVICVVCATPFSVHPSTIKRGYGRCCSQACNAILKTTCVTRNCTQCGAAYRARACDIRDGKGLYCSKPCAGAGRREARRLPPVDRGDGSWGLPIRAQDGSIRAYAIVDATDVARADQWLWSLSSEGYAYRKEDRVSIFLHRELLGLKYRDGIGVDHINRDRLDNRRVNLRRATQGQNRQNVPSISGSTSQYRGVSWNTAAGKWVATVTVNRKTTWLGSFISEAEAAEVARAARKRLQPFAVD